MENPASDWYVDFHHHPYETITVMFVFTNVSYTSNVEFDLDQPEQLIHS